MCNWERSDKTEGLIKALKFKSPRVLWPLVSSAGTKSLRDPASHRTPSPLP